MKYDNEMPHNTYYQSKTSLYSIKICMTMDNYQIAIQSMAVIFEETNILINHLLSLLDEEGHLQDIHIHINTKQ